MTGPRTEHDVTAQAPPIQSAAPPSEFVRSLEDSLGSHGAHAEIVTDPKRQRRILIAMCTALVAVIASVSGLNVAQQDLALDLGASQGQLLWVINGYTMALAALLLPIGAIGDRWGRKPILVAGLALFMGANTMRSEEHTSELQSLRHLVCRP